MLTLPKLNKCKCGFLHRAVICHICKEPTPEYLEFLKIVKGKS